MAVNLNLIIIATVLCAVTIEARTSNQCTGHREGERIRDVSNCQNFFTCLNGTPVLSKCSFPLYFNHITRECVQSDKATCFKCPANEAFIDLPYDNNCQQFIRCFNGYATQLTCVNGTLFDPEQRSCNIAEYVECACPKMDDPNNPTFIRSRDNCAVFFLCLNGRRLRDQCQVGLYFNTVTNQCDFPRNTDCIPPAQAIIPTKI